MEGPELLLKKSRCPSYSPVYDEYHVHDIRDSENESNVHGR